MRISLLCAAFCAALAPVCSVSAGSSSGGVVTQLIPVTNGVYTFNQDGARSGVPSCASSASSKWAIDASTDGGKAVVASIMTAFSLGKKIDVAGTGNCLTAQPDIEAVSYVAVFN